MIMINKIKLVRFIATRVRNFLRNGLRGRL